MDKDDLIETQRAMSMAADELRQLRRRCEVLQAKVDTMDLFALVLNTQPNYGSQAMSEDVVWMLEKQLRALNGAEPCKKV